VAESVPQLVQKATCLLPETGHEEKKHRAYRIATQVKDNTKLPQCCPSLK